MISIVAPCYNDAGNIPELVRRLNIVSEEMGVPFEIIVVDDASPDNAWEVILNIAKEYDNFQGFRFSRNFGQHLAITAGIAQSIGDYVVIMDGDLQDLPEEIPKIFRKIQEGYDLVFTVRKERRGKKARKYVSVLYRYVINKLSGLNMPHNISMMRIFTREFADNYLKFSEKHRSLGALFSWMGFRQTYVVVNHGERFSGKSTFTPWKLVVRAYNNISSFSTIPIAVIGYLGMLISLVSFLFGLLIVIRFFLGFPTSQSGWPSLICVISFSTGMIMLSLSVIGKYIANIYLEALDRPLYFIAEKTPERQEESKEELRNRI
jgi:dolichol-phosphate mannosyltransferase